jgi:hypothetical protein
MLWQMLSSFQYILGPKEGNFWGSLYSFIFIFFGMIAQSSLLIAPKKNEIKNLILKKKLKKKNLRDTLPI